MKFLIILGFRLLIFLPQQEGTRLRANGVLNMKKESKASNSLALNSLIESSAQLCNQASFLHFRNNGRKGLVSKVMKDFDRCRR